MNGLKSIPNWILWTAALLAAALVFRFAMRGYAYIGYTLAFIAALIVLHHYLPRGAWRAVTALVCVGLIYFCIVEIPIIANSRTDKDPERKYLVVLGAAARLSRSLSGFYCDSQRRSGERRGYQRGAGDVRLADSARRRAGAGHYGEQIDLDDGEP